MSHIIRIIDDKYFELVGHCHPRVTEAVTKQMQLQYTNTRYLNSRVINVSSNSIHSKKLYKEQQTELNV